MSAETGTENGNSGLPISPITKPLFYARGNSVTERRWWQVIRREHGKETVELDFLPGLTIAARVAIRKNLSCA